MSSADSAASDGRRPAQERVISTRSAQSRAERRSRPLNSRGSLRVWKSSSLVVIAMSMPSFPATSPNASCHPCSEEMAATGEESPRILVSSLLRYMGLSGTTIAPAFHPASSPITNCGTFCR